MLNEFEKELISKEVGSYLISSGKTIRKELKRAQRELEGLRKIVVSLDLDMELETRILSNSHIVYSFSNLNKLLSIANYARNLAIRKKKATLCFLYVGRGNNESVLKDFERILRDIDENSIKEKIKTLIATMLFEDGIKNKKLIGYINHARDSMDWFLDTNGNFKRKTIKIRKGRPHAKDRE